MSKIIGRASDFYRLRLMQVDASDGVEFEWREDILYRRPPETRIADSEIYRVEAVLVDDEETTVALRSFGDRDGAREWLLEAERDLGEMTKSVFEDSYFPDTAGA